MRQTHSLVLALLVVLAVSSRAAAGEPSPAWPSHRRAADWISTGTVVTSHVVDTIESFRAPDRGAALRRQLFRTGATIATTELLKRLTHRQRPDGSDRLSFPSGHTANAFASSNWDVRVSFPLALATGYLRTAAARHYPTDIAAGAGVGAFYRWVFRD